MTAELDYLGNLVRRSRLSRRDFLGRAAALGVSTAMAGTLYAQAARAQTPQRGGHLKAGMQGGESTNVLDPALNLSQVPFAFCRQWGEFLVRVERDGSLQNRIAEEITSSADAKTALDGSKVQPCRAANCDRASRRAFCCWYEITPNTTASAAKATKITMMNAGSIGVV